MVRRGRRVFLHMNPDGPDQHSAFETDDPAMAEALEWFARLRDDTAGIADTEGLMLWLDADPAHQLAYAEVETLWADLDAVSAPRALPGAFDGPAPKPLRWRWGGGALAASLALVLAFNAHGLWIAARADASTGTGEVRALTLADGTRVALDADSAIAVAIDPGSRRITLLKGRAWFDVVHEARPFTVALGNAQVRDIGTSFEVAERGEGGEVVVSQGRVELTTAGGRALQLTKGEAARFDVAGRSRLVEAVPGVAAWRQHQLQFVDQRVADILGDLARYGAGRPVLLDGALAGRRITGVVDLADPAAARDAVLARAGAQARRLGPWLFVTAS